MDFKKMSDEEIFEYLFISDYTEISSLEDSKYLLLKYKSFFRLLKAKKDRSDKEVISLKNKLNIKANEIKVYKHTIDMEKKRIHEFITEINNRKLTFKERWNGYIKINTE